MTHPTEGWEERFEEQFTNSGTVWNRGKIELTLDPIKSFISQELQRVREEERERIEKLFEEQFKAHKFKFDLEEGMLLKRLFNKAFHHGESESV